MKGDRILNIVTPEGKKCLAYVEALECRKRRHFAIKGTVHYNLILEKNYTL